MLAGLVVTVLVLPQSLAYAMLAGLPPQVGLYASILPLVAYAALGSSMTLAVGPVAGGWLHGWGGDYAWLYGASSAIGLGALAIALTFRAPAVPALRPA